VLWVDDLLVGVIRIKVDNSSLVMIDPDDGMIMGGQGMLQDRGFRASQSHAAGGGAL
jgi:hypothetical protein